MSMGSTSNTPQGYTALPAPKRRSHRVLKGILITGVAIVAAVGVTIAGFSWSTESDIDDQRDRITDLAANAGSVTVDVDAIGSLPAPVQRWVDFTFPGGFDNLPTLTEFTMEGDFRQPLKDAFSPTTAEQISATRTPAFVFSARVNMFPGFWARAYDAFGEGKMEMKAKLESAFTVVDETETPELNATSMQRWLLESPMYPAALLPGGLVTWEAIDDTHARAIAQDGDLSASLIATFRTDGSLQQFDAEKDGDLTTSYHGSGEHTFRDDYQLTDGIMLPHRFMIARAAGGEVFPYWDGSVTSVTLVAQ